MEEISLINHKTNSVIASLAMFPFVSGCMPFSATRRIPTWDTPVVSSPTLCRSWLIASVACGASVNSRKHIRKETSKTSQHMAGRLYFHAFMMLKGSYHSHKLWFGKCCRDCSGQFFTEPFSIGTQSLILVQGRPCMCFSTGKGPTVIFLQQGSVVSGRRDRRSCRPVGVSLELPIVSLRSRSAHSYTPCLYTCRTALVRNGAAFVLNFALPISGLGEHFFLLTAAISCTKLCLSKRNRLFHFWLWGTSSKSKCVFEVYSHEEKIISFESKTKNLA